LHDQALDFQELRLVFAGELLVPRERHVVVKLFPALDVVFEVDDEVIDGLVVHGRRLVRLRKLESGRLEKDERAAAEFARRDREAAVVE
jgi:hypothetical protein